MLKTMNAYFAGKVDMPKVKDKYAEASGQQLTAALYRLDEFVFVHVRFPPTSRLFPPACVNFNRVGRCIVCWYRMEI